MHRDQLPATVETKRLYVGEKDPAAKGSLRREKHQNFNKSAFDRFATEGAEVDFQPNEDRIAKDPTVGDEEIDGIIELRERKVVV